MAIEYINTNLPPSVKIEQLNQQTLELGGKESEGRFDKYELDNVFAQVDIGRQFNRRVLMGGTADDYTDWTHYYEQTGYSIWRCPVSDYLHNTVNELYFSDSGTPAGNIGALSSYEGQATSAADILTLLSMTSNEILARDWKWCFYNDYVYLTIRNSGAADYEGDYFVTAQSTAVRRQNFFVYNHQVVMNYESASYEPSPMMLAGLYVTDADTTDGYGNPYVHYTAGRVLICDTIYSIAEDYILMELGTINYVFVNSSGVVDTNTTGWPDVCVPMAIVVCDDSGILSITDQRTTINTMHVCGSRLHITAVTSDYTVVATDVVILCGAGNETFTVYLPVSVAEKEYYVKNVGTGVITVDASTVGGTTIDGNNTVTLNQNDCVQLVDDGTVYLII